MYNRKKTVFVWENKKMKTEIIKEEQYSVSCWSGGKTRQIYIYPPNSSYAQRDFIFRISSATVECEHSEFTALPGVKRLILPLSGKLHLYYEGHGEKELAPYEQDCFDGGWNTVSVGKATDFNLMLRSGAQGEITTVDLQPGEKQSLCNGKNEVLAVFAAQGCCTVEGEQESELPCQATAVILEEGIIQLKNCDLQSAKLICVRVKLPQRGATECEKEF